MKNANTTLSTVNNVFEESALQQGRNILYMDMFVSDSEE